jgi:hypothetical protein
MELLLQILAVALVVLGSLTLIGLVLLGRRGVRRVHADYHTEEPIVRLLTTLGLLSALGKLNPQPQVLAKTASYTILGTEGSGTIFTNRGAAGAVTFTLPVPRPALAGTEYRFLGHAAQNIIVAAATADTLVTLNDAAADSIAMQTANQILGGEILVICDGTQWFAQGRTVGVTYTVVTA